MGKVLAPITVTNWLDSELASAGFREPGAVRSIAVDEALVDTGATLLCLPRAVIEQLGLPFARSVEIETAGGRATARLFRGALLSVFGRDGSFDCLELPGSEAVLLGVIPLEQLGLRPDLVSQRLELLPPAGPGGYLTAF